MSDSIYLDNQATTPTDARVRDAMLPFLEVRAVGNPHHTTTVKFWGCSGYPDYCRNTEDF